VVFGRFRSEPNFLLRNMLDSFDREGKERRPAKCKDALAAALCVRVCLRSSRHPAWGEGFWDPPGSMRGRSPFQKNLFRKALKSPLKRASLRSLPKTTIGLRAMIPQSKEDSMNLGRSHRSRSSVRLSLLVGLLALIASGTVSLASNILVFPQLAAGGGYTSFVTLMNTNFNTPVNGTLTIYNSDGTLRSVDIVGQPSGSQFQVTIQPGSTVVLTASSSSGNVTGGMAKFVSDFPASGVLRFQFTGGQVGVPDSAAQTFATLPLTTSGGNDTGLAISNAGLTPVNIRLVFADANGTPVQTVDPPDLNPLPVNAQVAKFATQFGLTQAANQSTGSIQVQSTNAGTFNALALLLKDGLLSTTAVVPGVGGVSTAQDLPQFEGSYTGTIHDTSTGMDSAARIIFAPVQSIKTMVFILTFDSNNGPSEIPLFGPYDTNGLNLQQDLGFGPIALTVSSSGTMTFTAMDTRPPGPNHNISTINCTGQAHSDRITANCTTVFRT
jgi:hypothetical protein